MQTLRTSFALALSSAVGAGKTLSRGNALFTIYQTRIEGLVRLGTLKAVTRTAKVAPVGDWRSGLAEYNTGTIAVNEYGGIPYYREPQNQVRKIMRG